MISRQTAKKVKIWDIVNGKWTKKEGMEPSFVTTQYGENISRARILASVVAKFVSEDGNYGSITLDDGSDTIRAKVFKDLKILEPVNIGDIVDVIGKVREYTGETYIIPEVVRKIENPNFELLRRLEILYRMKGIKKAKNLVEKNREKYPNPEELKKYLIENYGLESEWIDLFLEKKEEKAEEDKNLLRKEILSIIEKNSDGIVYSQLISKVKAEETEIEKVIDELLSEGICYEPTPGKIKKI
jgi:RPA family protein